MNRTVKLAAIALTAVATMSACGTPGATSQAVGTTIGAPAIVAPSSAPTAPAKPTRPLTSAEAIKAAGGTGCVKFAGIVVDAVSEWDCAGSVRVTMVAPGQAPAYVAFLKSFQATAPVTVTATGSDYVAYRLNSTNG